MSWECCFCTFNTVLLDSQSMHEQQKRFGTKMFWMKFNFSTFFPPNIFLSRFCSDSICSKHCWSIDFFPFHSTFDFRSEEIFARRENAKKELFCYIVKPQNGQRNGRTTGKITISSRNDCCHYHCMQTTYSKVQPAPCWDGLCYRDGKSFQSHNRSLSRNRERERMVLASFCTTPSCSCLLFCIAQHSWNLILHAPRYKSFGTFIHILTPRIDDVICSLSAFFIEIKFQ